MAANYFQRLKDESQKFLSGLTTTQKALLGGVGAGAVVLVIFVSMWAQQPEWRVLFSGLSEKDAGAVVERLQEERIAYQIGKDGTTIKVSSTDLYDTRLKLATEGIVKEGGVLGYEIFDKDQMGMTSQVFNLQKQRALEGELSRTIQQMLGVEAATVHLAIPKKQIFTELDDPVTSSVRLKLVPDHVLVTKQIRGISKLVAGSVPGLEEKNITIIDNKGNILFDADLLADENGQSLAKLNAEQLEYQKSVETRIRRDVEKQLGNVVGRENVNVQVKAEVDFDQEEITSRTFTPNGNDEDLRAIRSEREVKEAGRGKNVTPGGVPGAQSNIPTYQEVSGEGNSAFSREDKTRNFEVPETLTKRVKSTGKIKRLTVSVAMNSLAPAIGAGEEGLSEDDPLLTKLRRLVIGAAGADLSRGDRVEVHTMVFDDTALKADLAAMEREKQREFWKSVLTILLLMFSILILFITLYMAFGRRKLPDEGELLDEEDMLLEAPPDEEEGEEIVLALHEPPELLELREAAGRRAEAVKSLTQMAKEDPANMARLLRAWMTDN